MHIHIYIFTGKGEHVWFMELQGGTPNTYIHTYTRTHKHIFTGKGEHVWFMELQGGTPFQTQNRYKGDWKSGKRDGQGVFEYADGSKYVGEWANNMKVGVFVCACSCWYCPWYAY